jgi:hypothetical protein
MEEGEQSAWGSGVCHVQECRVSGRMSGGKMEGLIRKVVEV